MLISFFKERLSLIACLIFPCLLAVWFAFDHSWPYWDAADHVRVEFQYADLLRHIKPFNLHWWHSFLTVNYCYPPTVHIFDGITKAVLGNGRWVDAFSLICFSLILSSSVFALGKILFKSSRIAALSVVIINCYPLVANLSHQKLLDFPHLSLFCMGLWSLLYWRESPSLKRAVISGIGLGLACTTKQGASFFLVGPSLYFLYQQIRLKRYKEAGQLVLSGSIVVCFLLVWFCFNWHDIHAYMSRNSGIIGGRTLWTAFLPNLEGYLLPFPALLGLPLTGLFVLGLLTSSKRIWATVLPVVIASLVGLLCMSVLPFQLPECRYIVPCLLFPALFTAAQLSHNLQNGKLILRVLSILLFLLGIFQFFVQNYCPYPIPAPEALTHSIFGSEGERRGSLEPSYCPTPAGDPYAQEWVIQKCSEAVDNRSCWLNMLPSTPELSVHTLELVAKYHSSNVRPTTVRLWTPVGDHVDFVPNTLINYDFFLFKTGLQGLHFDSPVSTANYQKIEDWVKNSGNYQLLAERKITDGSQLSIYFKSKKAN